MSRIRHNLRQSFALSNGWPIRAEAIPVEWKMVALSLASNPTEARKFFRDDEARPGTLGLEVVRVGMPSLSRAWGSISIVVVSRNADVAQDHHRSSGSKWRYDEEDHCSREREQ